MPKPDEPYWLPGDTEKALAYEVAIRDACGNCGLRREDYFDAEGRPLDPPPVMPEVQDCPYCAARQLASMDLQEDARSAAGDSDDAQMIAARALAGLSITLVPYRPPSIDDDDDGEG